MKERDFSNASLFPGTAGNPFDIILHRLETLQRIPGPLFALILLALAFLAARFDRTLTALWWAFFLSDWILLALLPRLNKSFGMPKPPVLMLAVLRCPFALLPFWPALIFQLMGSLLVIYAFWVEPHRIHLTRQTLRSNYLTPGQPVRIMHLGDLHMERITSRERQLQEIIDSEKPDLILFSGDFLNLSYLHDAEAHAAVREVVSQWQAPGGVWGVSGSPAVDLPDVLPPLLKDLPLIWLQDECRTLIINGQTLNLIGLTCTHRPFDDAPRLEKLMVTQEPHFNILLHHSPDLAPAAARLCVDLQLSGHTHGGQVRLPLVGALFTGSLYGRFFQQGRMQLEHLTLYITRGLGLEGAGAPRVRFLCPPEVTIWELDGKP